MRSSICARGSAPHRQAGAGVQPRPCRRHRRTHAPRADPRARGQIWNVADDEPAPPQDVIAYAAALLGLPPPPEEPFEDGAALADGGEFYADNKRVSIAKAKSLLGFAPAYPTYREGLTAWRRRGRARESRLAAWVSLACRRSGADASPNEGWKSLDFLGFLVRIETFQWVARDFRRDEFSRAHAHAGAAARSVGMGGAGLLMRAA